MTRHPLDDIREGTEGGALGSLALRPSKSSKSHGDQCKRGRHGYSGLVADDLPLANQPVVVR